jgi:lipoprotein-anchoring transpeptidase ErfK/SrfK
MRAPVEGFVGRVVRMLPVLVMASVAVGSAAAVVPADARSTPVRSSQELATLLNAHHAVATLRSRDTRIATIRPNRPITGGPTVLPVIRHATTSDGVHWLRVMLPGRPRGFKGWIAQRRTVRSTTGWHLVVSTSGRRVRVYRHGRLLRKYRAIVGKPSTPTPHGKFFVEESVIMPEGQPGGPFALALSVRSDVLQEFEGGPGQIAMHGLANLGGTLGTAVSHGCIRLSNRSIGWLAARIPPGAPVTIGP